MISGFTHSTLSGKCYPLPPASACGMVSVQGAISDYCRSYYSCSCTSFSLDSYRLSITYKAIATSSWRDVTLDLADCYIEDSGSGDSGGSGLSGTGIFDSVPIQDIVVFCFIFVMFGIGFIGGLKR